VLAGCVGGGTRSLLALLGGLVTALGVVLLAGVAPDRVHRWLGAGGPYGWLCAIVGVFLVVSARFLPDLDPHDGHVVT